MTYYDLADILAITKKIKAKVEAMTLEELNAYAEGIGFLGFIDEETDFAEWLNTLPDDEAGPIITMIMGEVQAIYIAKGEPAQSSDIYLLSLELSETIYLLPKDKVQILVDIAKMFAKEEAPNA